MTHPQQDHAALHNLTAPSTQNFLLQSPHLPHSPNKLPKFIAVCIQMQFSNNEC